MKLSISNIGWTLENDETVYEIMKDKGFSGLEIAPTRIFPENPYDKLDDALNFKEEIQKKYGFSIPSMQSIWFGHSEKVFGDADERNVLVEYTKKAMEFAKVIGCNNLVFGCPRNRAVPENMNNEEVLEIAVPFFRELGEYALSCNTVLSMEANPPIYNTNFINDTKSAIELVKNVNSKGFLLNLDIGTMIENNESADVIKGYVNYINHVHISEPYLKPVCERELHAEVVKILKNEGYNSFVSIEMGKTENISDIIGAINYVKDIK